jgi:membrane protease YdiL (CAAX protease family)
MDNQNRPAWNTAEKTQLKWFLLIAYGLTAVMGVLLGISQRMGNSVDVFPNAQMYYPAAGVMLACFLTRRNDPLLPRRFFGFFLVLTGALVALCIASVLFPALPSAAIVQYFILAGSALAWLFYLSEKKEKRAAYGLRWANGKTSFLMMLLFIALYFARTFISVLLSGGMAEYLPYWKTATPWIVLIALVPSYFLAFTAFFGEEYGWRCFLQPLLQKRFGVLGGTLVLGVVWGLWHLPLNLFYYSPATSLQSIAAQQIVCITLSVFFAFAYLKTQNIWVPVALHFLNNNLIPVITGSADIANQTYAWGDIGWSLVLNAAVFLPFLLSGVFRSPAPAGAIPGDTSCETAQPAPDEAD